jgi:hypothetical protein
MPSELASKLMDAHMVGDQQAIQTIQAQINEMAENAAAKPSGDDAFRIRTVFSNDNASAIKMYDFMNEKFGVDWYDWELETIERMLFITYGVALEGVNRDKLFAIRHVCISDGCFSDWFELNQVALSFSGSVADFECLRTPSPGMFINAVKTVVHIRPDRNNEFGIDVLKYLCIAFIDAGIICPPPSLFDLLQSTFIAMVQKSTSDIWPDILKRSRELINGKRDIEENTIDIQASRILRVELAALSYQG